MKTLLQNAWRGYPAISLKSLALYRVCLGALAAYAVLRRWVVSELFYSEEGLYPSAAVGLAETARFESFMNGIESPIATHAIFALALFISIAFAAGAFMRAIRWLLFPALFTIHLRAPSLLTGAEGVLHHQAIFAALLPWSALAHRKDRKRIGESMDASPDRSDNETAGVRTWIYPLVLFQLALIYLITAITKNGESWMDGTAAFRSLASPTHSTALGGLMGELLPMSLLKALSFGTLAAEAALPFLLLTPFGRRGAHLVAALLMLALHGGILLTLEVGIFSAAMLVHLPLLWHPRERPSFGLALIPRPKWKRALEAGLLFAFVYLAVARASRDNPAMQSMPSFAAMHGAAQLPLPELVERSTRQLALGQLWQMFAPDPPGSDRVLIVEAITEKEEVFDPWRGVSMGVSEPMRTLARSAIRSRLYGSYEFMLRPETGASMVPFFSDWVFRQKHPQSDEAIERFDAWFIILSTASRHPLLEDKELDAALGLMPLPIEGAIPIQSFKARGVWEPERAFDGLIVPDGTDSRAPIVSPMSAGCPYLVLDLGEAHALKSALLQAAAVDHFLLDGSVDGERFERLGEAARIEAKGLRTRIIPLEGSWRYLRVRPSYARHSRHHLAEIALFSHELDERTLGIPEVPTEGSWRYSRARPAVVGAFSAMREPEPGCEAEASSR